MSLVSTEQATTEGPRGSTDRAKDHRDRIARLNESLLGLQDGLDTERTSRFEDLQGKMTLLDEKVNLSQDMKAHKFHVLKEQLEFFGNSVNCERLSREEIAEEKRRDIETMDKALGAALAEELEERNETESRVMHIFETRTNELKEEVIKAGRDGIATEANFRKYLEVDIPKLRQYLEEEIENRETMEQRMLRKAMDEVTQLQAAVLAEKKAREDMEQAMLRMMEDIVSRVQVEVAKDKKERERTEQTLLGLLNDPLHKLQLTQASRSG